MASLLHGPHDGDTYPAGGNQNWTGLLLPVTPLLHDAQPGEPAAYYAWTGSVWKFEDYVPREALRTFEDLRVLMFEGAAP